jgi:transposase
VSDATGVAEALLGLPGFRVLDVHETPGEVVIRIETSAGLVGCPGCGVMARAHGRMVVDYRDLAAFGRPARLRWRKRRFRCEEPACEIGTWTETSPAFSSRCLLTNRAGLECCLQVGLNARPVAQMARELGVCWDTVMSAVREHGEPLVDDPARVGEVTQLGVDETTWLQATKEHPTRFATGLVNLERRVVIDVVEGNSGQDLGRWLDHQPASWLGRVRVVATDLAESYRSGLDGRLDHAIRVADPFHVVRVANRCLDMVRRRVQNATLGHRGRKRDPLFRIRKLLVTGAERLDGTGLDRMLLGTRLGDPDQEVLGAWLAKESVRDVYLTNRVEEAETLLDKAIEGCRLDPVGEVRSLGNTLARWRPEILNHHRTGASNECPSHCTSC